MNYQLEMYTTTCNASFALVSRKLAACEQHVPAWELRASMSLARLWASQQRNGEAHEQLAQVLGRFTEGHGSADLRAAADLLEALQ